MPSIGDLRLIALFATTIDPLAPRGLLTKTDASAAASGTVAEPLCIASDRRDFALLFVQNLVEPADGFFQFSAEPFSPLSITFHRKLSDISCPTGTGYGTFGTLATLATLAASGFTGGFGLSFSCPSSSADAFPVLAHATDAAGQCARVATVAARSAFLVAGTVALTFAAGLAISALRTIRTAAGALAWRRWQPVFGWETADFTRTAALA